MSICQKNNADTLDIKNGKHTISFHKGNPDTPNSITVIIDNKFYSGNLMDAKLCELDHIGVEFTEARKKWKETQKLKIMLKHLAVLSTRKVINTPISAASEGKSLSQSLMQLVGHTMSKAMQSR